MTTSLSQDAPNITLKLLVDNVVHFTITERSADLKQATAVFDTGASTSVILKVVFQFAQATQLRLAYLDAFALTAV